MKHSAPLLLPQNRELRRQKRELDGVEEVGLSGTVSADDGVVAGGEGLGGGTGFIGRKGVRGEERGREIGGIEKVGFTP